MNNPLLIILCDQKERGGGGGGGGGEEPDKLYPLYFCTVQGRGGYTYPRVNVHEGVIFEPEVEEVVLLHILFVESL